MVLMLVLDVTGSHIGGCRADLTRKTGQKARKDWKMDLTESPQLECRLSGIWVMAADSSPPVIPLCPQAKGSQAQQL